MINRNIRQRWDCSSLKRPFLSSLVQNLKQNLYLIQDFIRFYFSSRWRRNRFCVSQTYHRILSHVSIQFYYSYIFKKLPLYFLSFTFIPNTLMISLRQKTSQGLFPDFFTMCASIVVQLCLQATLKALSGQTAFHCGGNLHSTPYRERKDFDGILRTTNTNFLGKKCRKLRKTSTKTT